MPEASTGATATATAPHPGAPAAARPASTARRRRSPRHGPHGWVHLVLAAGGVVMVFPFVWQLLTSLSTNAQVMSMPPTFWPGQLQWGNYAEVFTKLPFLQEFWVSVSITVIRTVGQLVLCSMAGYAFARMRFPLRGVLLALVLSILMVPPQVYLIPQYQIINGLGWLDTVAGIAAPGVFSAFGTFLMMQFFRGVPDSLEEAARLDGANPFQVFWRIMLPLAGPSLGALTIITVLWSWNDLLWPLIVSTRAESMPLAAGIATLAGRTATDYTVMMAASALAMAPILLLFVVMQRRVIEGLAHSGLK